MINEREYSKTKSQTGIVNKLHPSKKSLDNLSLTKRTTTSPAINDLSKENIWFSES